MRIFTITIISIIAITFSSQVNAQFSTSNSAPYNSVNYLINNVFAGGNVNISNITSYGAASQIGYFSGNTVIGMDSGIVLSTGTINELCNGTCPNASTTPGAPGTANGVNFGFPWMGATTGSVTNNNLYNVSASVPGLLGFGSSPNDVNDAAAISFDFVPTLDTMRFKFIFASKEWPSFPCSSYNDVFGFFVSGPGITGTYFSPPGFPNGAENFANVPGTSIPITITSINAAGYSPASCTNSYASYFVPNVAATSGMDAHYTTIMEVEFPVQACQTYNFTMAIADGSDGALSSFVMLEANSFLSTGVQVAFNATYDLGGDSILYEGCGGVDMNITRADNIQNADTIHFNISGNATNGIDYPLLPDSVIFAPGQTDFTHTFTIPNDYIVEGPETIMVFVTDTDLVTCTGTGDTLLITIHDPIPLTSDATVDTIMCTDQNPILLSNADGLGPFSHVWSTGDTLDTLTVNPTPTVTTDYYVTLTDACNIYTLVDTATLVIQNPIMSIEAIGDTITCEQSGAPIDVNITNQMPGTQIQWNTGQTFAPFWGSRNPLSVTYVVTVTQPCAAYYLVDSAELVVLNPPFTVDLADDTINCTDGGSLLIPQITNSTPSFSYSWSNGVNILPNNVNPNTTTTYYFTATDACGVNSVMDSAVVNVINNPVYGTVKNQTINCIGDSVPLEALFFGGYQPYSYTWNTGETDSIIIGTSTMYQNHYSVSVTDICKLDTVVASAFVQLAAYDSFYIAAIANDTFNCTKNAVQLNKPQLIGGSGDHIISWDNWATTTPFTFSIIDSTTSFTVEAYDECTHDSASHTVTFVVREHDSLIVILPADTHLCPEDEALLTAMVSGGAGNFKYAWNNGENAESISITQTIDKTYTITVTDECGTTAYAQTQVTISEPTAAFEHVFFDANNVAFENYSENAAYYFWEFGDGDTSTAEDPLKKYNVSKTYNVLLTVQDSFGCSNSIYKEVVPPLNVFIPTAFTPNGDDLNEYFEVYGEGFRSGINNSKKFRMVIYDRWGMKVFETTNPSFKWDGTFNGKKLAAGTYMYMVTVEGAEQQKIEMDGVVTIIR